MLTKSKAFSGFSVDDIDEAKSFYQGTLGLMVRDNPMGMIELHIEGGNPILVYAKSDHMPATYTVLNFPVKDIAVAVEGLSEQGVVFEQYKDLDTDEKGIIHNEGLLIAWFKDPSGNILSVIEEH